jgi:hypothetical protein
MGGKIIICSILASILLKIFPGIAAPRESLLFKTAETGFFLRLIGLKPKRLRAHAYKLKEGGVFG